MRLFFAIILALVPLSANAQERRFDWKGYNFAPVVVAPSDDVTFVRVFTGEEGADKQKLVYTSLCQTFYRTDECDPAFLAAVTDMIRAGQYDWKFYPQGNTDLDYGLAHGVMVKGVRRAMVTKNPPVIHTKDHKGKLVDPRARLLKPMLVPNVGWVRIAIFEICYNASAEDAEAPPPPPVVVPEPVAPVEPAKFEFKTAPPPKVKLIPSSSPVVVESRRWIPCTGKYSRWVCIGAGVAVGGWLLKPDHQPKAPPKTDLTGKSGGPGGR